MNQQQFKEQVKFKTRTNSAYVIGNSKPIHMLHDYDKNRIVAFSYWTPTINALNETNLNSTSRFWQNAKNSVLPKTATMDKPWMCTWDYENNYYIISEEDLSYEDLYYYNLMAEKSAALDEIFYRILHYRRPILNSLNLQESVYMFKYIEANDISKMDESASIEETEYPFVFEYATLSGTDMRTAASQILFKSKIYKTALCNTETMRMKYVKKIKECTEIPAIETILNEFYAEGEIYGRL